MTVPTIGGKIDHLYSLKEKKKGINEQLKDVEAEIQDAEAELLELMDQQKTTKGGGSLASASVTEVVRPAVDDWDLFYAFLHKNKYYHLLERRPSVTGCRELFETKGKIPGVTPFVKRTVNTRKV